MSSVRLRRCRLHDNYAVQGGAAYSGSERARFESVDTSFARNRAAEGGGAVFLQGGSRAGVTGGVFLKNRSDTGGAIYISPGVPLPKDELSHRYLLSKKMATSLRSWSWSSFRLSSSFRPF